MTKDLFIDVETYSSVDLSECGAYKYTASPDFEILIFSYAVNNGPVYTVDLAQGEEMPEGFIAMLLDPEVCKHAHNAVFERLSFKRIGYDIPAEQWYCTSVKAAYCGLPLGLDQVSKVLDLKNKKLDTGKLLIKYFSCPCKPTKVNGGRTRNYPEHAPEKWEMYKEYNMYDVLAEREIYYLLESYQIPDIERTLYCVDQAINDRGIMIDRTLASNAIAINEEYTTKLQNELIELTGLTNPNSASQLKAWLQKKSGTEVKSLAKEAMPEVLETFKDNSEVLRVLDIKNRISRTSIKKYYAMINCATPDDRVRGTFQFYGANRTGRWAGRLLQLQNLARNHVDNIEIPRELVRQGDLDTIEMLYDDASDILSQLIRTGIVAPEDKILSVADFSAIEARVISWLADEKWRMEVFHGDGKIYEATGAKMFGVPIKAITKGSELRQKSKISELALGFGGAVGAMRRMGGERMGLSDAEMMSLTRKWREANPKIVELWGEIEDCAIDAITYCTRIVGTPQNLEFIYDGKNLQIVLPSGRSLFYNSPYLVTVKGRKEIRYKGQNQVTKQWETIETYGGKLTENVVQATARDLLAFALINLHKAGFEITMHIHDEIIAEIPCDGTEQETYNRMVAIMSTPPEWAKDLPLGADGYLTKFYKKD